MRSRRSFLETLAGAVLAYGTAAITGRRQFPGSGVEAAELPTGATESARLDVLPGKQLLIKRTYRPPNYETPLDGLSEFYTPNDRFFVRYHLASIPAIDPSHWMLRIGGEGISTPLELSLDHLKQDFVLTELPALCVCAGNRRGLIEPHVPGIQWSQGAMGNALWRGVRLRDVLAKAGLKREAVEITFDGADSGVFEKTPDLVKSLPLSKALDENTVIAIAMNGEPLPHWNGFPARLVVPGWAATYWVKHLANIHAIARPLDSYWMRSAYRIPKGDFGTDDRFPSQDSAGTLPVTEIPVNSLITEPRDGQLINSNDAITVKGIAWDGGHGIASVDISIDDGANWRPATLDTERGLYTWRFWTYSLRPSRGGPVRVMARATNRLGQTQPARPVPNPAGYHHNAVSAVTIHVA